MNGFGDRMLSGAVGGRMSQWIAIERKFEAIKKACMRT